MYISRFQFLSHFMTVMVTMQDVTTHTLSQTRTTNLVECQLTQSQFGNKDKLKRMPQTDTGFKYSNTQYHMYNSVTNNADENAKCTCRMVG